MPNFTPVPSPEIDKKNPEISFFDTHCHLQEEIFSPDIENIIEQMVLYKVDKFLTIGTDFKQSENALRLRDKYPKNCLVSVGLDPSNAENYINDHKKLDIDFEKIANLARKNKVSAIGETGLDRGWAEGKQPYPLTPNSLEYQKLLFEKHVILAKELDLPLIVHQRQALKPVLEILKKHEFVASATAKNKKGIFHCFTESIKEAQKIIENGFYVGIGGIVTFNSASRLQDAVKSLVKDAIVFETDAPFLSPEPYRGQRNDPTRIPIIAEFVESLKSQSISQTVYSNSLKLFKDS